MTAHKLQWTKAGSTWFAIDGQFRAEVRAPEHPVFMYHWKVFTPAKQGGSGGTSSAAASKRCAENEIVRFKEWLRKEVTP